MGRKGARLTATATAASDDLVSRLASLGGVSHRKMFGGYGIFADSVMFGLISSEGVIHFTVTEDNLARYEAAKAEKFGRMPYHTVPAEILENHDALLEWAAESLCVARKERAA